MATPNMSCPAGGQFYACGYGSRFVGCCGRNPCDDSGCDAGDLVPTSFDPKQHGQLPDQQCSAGNFYTCSTTNPPFWGCCDTSPCDTGCASGSLAAAFLSNNPDLAKSFLSLNETYTTSSTPTSITSTSALTSTPAALSSTDSKNGSSVSTGAIAGGVVGGVAVLAVFILGLLWLLHQRKKGPSTAQHSHARSPVHGSESVISSNAKHLTESYDQSPMLSSYRDSPSQPSFSPRSPSDWLVPHSVAHERPAVYELPGIEVEAELESPPPRGRRAKGASWI